MGSQKQRQSIQARTRGREVRPRDQPASTKTVKVWQAMLKAAKKGRGK